MLKQLHAMQLKTKLFLMITAFYFAATSATALVTTESTANHADYEYAYQDIYASLIPDEHPYPDNFPYRIGLLYNTFIDLDSNIFEQDLRITSIRLYDGNTLIQELPTQSRGLYIPEFEDFNFDGYFDIAIPLVSSDSHAFPYQYWLYNPQTQRFEDAPPSLQALSAPEVDIQHQSIYVYRFDKDASQNIDVYHWKDNQLTIKESLNSYSFPIKVGGETLYCDNDPYYDEARGQAVYPFRVTQSALGEQTFSFYDWNEDLNYYIALEYNDFLQRTHQFCAPRHIQANDALFLITI